MNNMDKRGFENCVNEISNIINKNNGYIKPSNIEKREREKREREEKKIILREKEIPPIIKISSHDIKNDESISTLFHMDIEDIIDNIKCNYSFLENLIEEDMETEDGNSSEDESNSDDSDSSDNSDNSDNSSDDDGDNDDEITEYGIFIESGDDTPLLYKEKRMRKKDLSYSFSVNYSTLVILRELICYMKLMEIPKINSSYIFSGEKYGREREVFDDVMKDLMIIYEYLSYYNENSNGDKSLCINMFSKLCEYPENVEYDYNKKFNVNMAINKIDLIINNVRKNLFLQRYFNRLKVFIYSINDIIV
jgi:hypothetical protein